MFTNLYLIIADDLEYEEFNHSTINRLSMTSFDKRLDSLKKQYKQLSEKVTTLEQSELTSTVQKVVNRIDRLEKEVKCCLELLGKIGVTRQVAHTTEETALSTSVTDQQHNRELLQRATCEQVFSVECRTATLPVSNQGVSNDNVTRLVQDCQHRDNN